MILAQATNSPDIQQAVETIAKAVFPHVSASQIEVLIPAIFVIARVLRKALPDNIQEGGFGRVLKHLALEINPASKSANTTTTTVITTAPVAPPKQVTNNQNNG